MKNDGNGKRYSSSSLRRRVWYHKQVKNKNRRKRGSYPNFLSFYPMHHRVLPIALSAYRGLKAIGDEGQWGPPS
jgi:hypothetical protein